MINSQILEAMITETLSGSESLYGFCGWLTSREEQTVMSGRDDPSVIVDLISKFCKVNELEEPRDNWTDNLTHPNVVESMITEILAVHDECDSFYEIEEGDIIQFWCDGNLLEAKVNEIVFLDSHGDYMSFKVETNTHVGLVDMEDVISVYRNKVWKKII